MLKNFTERKVPFVRSRWFIVFLLLVSSIGLSQERFFYTGKSYGSEAMYNPVYLLLNGSYDIIQLEGHTRDVFTYHYGTGAANVLRNLGSPFRTIGHYGVGKFLKQEVFPIGLGIGEAQWWPNYQLHLIGGGMTYVATAEWYEHYGFPVPNILSMVTMGAYHFLNEVVENGNYVGETVDPIADLYIFDVGSVILFSFDGVKRFFRDELHLADWSLQPSLALPTWTLQNNGQFFSMKWKLPFSESVHLFYYFGLRGLLGLSKKFDDGSAFSFGLGLRAIKLETLERTTNTQTVDLRWSAGVFFDRENSLLASLFWSDYLDNTLNLNIYPGIVHLGGFSPGLWFVVSKNSGTIVGLTTIWAPGLGYEPR